MSIVLGNVKTGTIDAGTNAATCGALSSGTIGSTTSVTGAGVAMGSFFQPTAPNAADTYIQVGKETGTDNNAYLAYRHHGTVASRLGHIGLANHDTITFNNADQVGIASAPLANRTLYVNGTAQLCQIMLRPTAFPDGAVSADQGTSLTWNKTGAGEGNGTSTFVNHPGAGAPGGFEFGELDADASGVYRTLIRSNIGLPLAISSSNSSTSQTIATFYQAAVPSTNYVYVNVGLSGSTDQSVALSYQHNTTAGSRRGHIGLASHETINFDNADHVGIGMAPSSTYMLAVNGYISGTNMAEGSFSAEFSGPWAANVTVTIYYSRAMNVVTLNIPNILATGNNAAATVASTTAVLPAGIVPTRSQYVRVYGMTTTGVVSADTFLQIHTNGNLYSGLVTNSGYADFGATTGTVGFGHSGISDPQVITYLLN
jgi:hypothetical protein